MVTPAAIRHSSYSTLGKSKNNNTTDCANKEKTKGVATMISQSKDQPIRVRDDQLTILTRALGVISQLVSTLQTSNIYTSDIYTSDFYTNNMRHYTSNRPGESLQHDLVTKVPVPDSSQSTCTTPRVAYKNLDKILPPKPDLLESDTSDIEDWDNSSESEAGMDEATKMLDSLCYNIATLDQPTPNMSTHSTTALDEFVPDPTHVVGKAGLKVSIPRIQAPSPPRVNRVDAGPAPDSTGPSFAHTSTREKWLSKSTLHNIETAVV